MYRSISISKVIRGSISGVMHREEFFAGVAKHYRSMFKQPSGRNK